MAGRRGSPRLVAARVSTPGWTPDVWLEVVLLVLAGTVATVTGAGALTRTYSYTTPQYQVHVIGSLASSMQ